MSNPTYTTKEDALGLVRQFLMKDKGADAVADLYTEKADKYDTMIETIVFKGPELLGKYIKEVLGDRFDAKIIDVCAGTGVSGYEVKRMGYNDIDAIDSSQGMLDVAAKKEVYGKLICAIVGGENSPIEDGTYDVATICGGIGENHLPMTGLRDIIKMVKSGGYVINIYRETANTHGCYGDGLDVYMKQLETEGLWVEQKREVLPTYAENANGLLFIHRVL